MFSLVLFSGSVFAQFTCFLEISSLCCFWSIRSSLRISIAAEKVLEATILERKVQRFPPSDLVCCGAGRVSCSEVLAKAMPVFSVGSGWGEALEMEPYLGYLSSSDTRGRPYSGLTPLCAQNLPDLKVDSGLNRGDLLCLFSCLISYCPDRAVTVFAQLYHSQLSQTII